MWWVSESYWKLDLDLKYFMLSVRADRGGRIYAKHILDIFFPEIIHRIKLFVTHYKSNKLNSTFWSLTVATVVVTIVLYQFN